MLRVYAYVVKNGYTEQTSVGPPFGTQSIIFRFATEELKFTQSHYLLIYKISRTKILRALYA